MCTCFCVLQQTQFGEHTTVKASYDEIRHDVKQWMKLTVESDEGLHQQDMQAQSTSACLSADLQTESRQRTVFNAANVVTYIGLTIV